MYSVLLTLLLASSSSSEMMSGNRIRNQTQEQPSSHFNVSSGTVRGSLTVSTLTATGQDSNGYSIKSSSGIDAASGIIVSTAIKTNRLYNGVGGKFIGPDCNVASNQFMYGASEDGVPACSAVPDTTVGNEVTDTANNTLTRSGSGTSGSPYKLQVNMNNSNNWNAIQTFENGANFGSTAGGETNFDMSGFLTMDGNASITLSGADGYITGASSINASAFFGDGSHLTGISPGESNTYTSSKTFTNDLKVVGAISATTATFTGHVASSATLSIGTGTVSTAQFDRNGVLRFTGEGPSGGSGYRVATNACAFRANAAPGAGFCFFGDSGGTYGFTDSSEVRVASLTVAGNFDIRGSYMVDNVVAFSSRPYVEVGMTVPANLASGTTFFAFTTLGAITLRTITATVQVAGVGTSSDTVRCNRGNGTGIETFTGASTPAGTVGESLDNNVNIITQTRVSCHLESGASTRPGLGVSLGYVFQ